MSTEVEIKNIDGPDYIIVTDYDGRRTILKPGQRKTVVVCHDNHFDITEADKIYEPEENNG